jgi:hypothetical protein
MDFLVRIRNMDDFDDNRYYLPGEETENNIVFYYESHKKSLIGSLTMNTDIHDKL